MKSPSAKVPLQGTFAKKFEGYGKLTWLAGKWTRNESMYFLLENGGIFQESVMLVNSGGVSRAFVDFVVKARVEEPEAANEGKDEVEESEEEEEEERKFVEVEGNSPSCLWLREGWKKKSMPCPPKRIVFLIKNGIWCLEIDLNLDISCVCLFSQP